MPSVTLPTVPHLEKPFATNEHLEYAGVATIDISQASTPEGRLSLVPKVLEALEKHGFFYAIDHGYTKAQNDRIFDIANVPFCLVPEEEKRVYAAQIKESGSYQGYKFREYWHIDLGVRDQIEHYNLNKDTTKRKHPKALRPLLPEIQTFIDVNHINILHSCLRILALGMDLPEDTFVNEHVYSAEGETRLRFMKYFHRSEEDEEKTNNVWLKGHVDMGSLTLNWSQPVAALQVRSPNGIWRWVKHIENAVVVTVGDALNFLSGGFYKGTVHRVVQPPPDQRSTPRLGLLYFGMPDDNVRLSPHTESPVLAQHGVSADNTQRFGEGGPPLMETWRKGRVATYGQEPLKRVGAVLEEQVVSGVVIRHYS